MNDRFSPQFVLNNSGLGCFLTLLLVGLVLGSVGLGWIVNGCLILLCVLLLAPVVAFWGLRWWLQKNLVEDSCPSCGYEFTGFNRTECRCPSCGEVLQVENGQFRRLTPPGTIDVEAVEVSARQFEN